jgi:TolB-like protein
VVPFVDPASDANATFNRDLTEAFVAALVNAAPDDIVVIGPSTTAQHFTEGGSLPEVAAAVNADFVLHGGYRSSADIFFVEVVLPDGAHLYAQRMDLDLNTRATAPAEVIAAMTASMLEALGR